MKRFIFYLTILTAWSLYFFFDIHKTYGETHKGNTYPLKTFSDPELEKEVKEVESRDPDKWEGYIEFMGKPGTARSLGQMDFFAPFYQDKNDLFFFNVRGQLDNSDSSEYNIGIGHRHLFPEYIFGYYGYYDRRYSDKTGEGYQQATLGMEILSEQWDFRVNGYIPETKKWEKEYYKRDSQLKINKDKLWVNHNQTDYNLQEKALPGFDAEIGYKLSDLFEDTRLYVGGYHFIGGNRFDSVTGPRVRLETRIHDLPYLGTGSRLMMGVETQYDKPRGSQTFGLVSLRIPFGVGGKQTKPMTGLRRRMVEPIVRDIDIVTSKNTVTTNKSKNVKALNSWGEAYTQVVELDSSKTIEQINTQMETLVAAGEVPLMIMKQDGAKTPIDLTGATISGGWTWAMAGKSIKVQSKNPFNGKLQTSTTFIPGGKTPIIKLTPIPLLDSQGNIKPNDAEIERLNTNAIILSDKTHVNGFVVDAEGFTHGIIINSSGTAYITNADVSNANQWGGIEGRAPDGRGIVSYGKGAVLYVSDTKSHDNSEEGFRVNNGAKMILDNVESSGSRGGVFAGDRVILEIKNSSFHDNWEGVNAWNFNKVTISKSKMFNNKEEGVEAGGGKDFNIFDSKIYNNNKGVVGQDGYDGGNNKAVGGGGLTFHGIKRVTIKNTVIRDNYKGLLVESLSEFEDSPSRVTLDNVTIINNGDNYSVMSMGDSIVTVKGRHKFDGNCLSSADHDRPSDVGAIIIDGTRLPSAERCP